MSCIVIFLSPSGKNSPIFFETEECDQCVCVFSLNPMEIGLLQALEESTRSNKKIVVCLLALPTSKARILCLDSLYSIVA